MSKINKVIVERAITRDVTGIVQDTRSRSHPSLLTYFNPENSQARLEAKDRERTDFHLYFLTAESPKEGEWVFYPNYFKPVKRYKRGEISNTPLKIVGSTDESLGLPGPSKKFKEDYCDLNGNVGDLYLEFEQEFVDAETNTGRVRRFYGDYKPKVYESKLVFTTKKSTLKQIIDENPHLREEFDELIYSAMKHVTYSPVNKLHQWKLENGFK